MVLRLLLYVSIETVEKVPKQILRGDAEKNDFTECTTINDLTIMKGRETPKNKALTLLKGFSTVSSVIVRFQNYSGLKTRR
jgi:vancomycin permeability regulator SanA